MAKSRRVRLPRSRNLAAALASRLALGQNGPAATDGNDGTAGLAALSAKPWDGYPVPDQIYMPHGMVGFEERRMLYWLGAEHYGGAGVIVDAGAYLGASAFALSAGLARSRHAHAPLATVYSYDRFVADDEYIRLDISQRLYPVPVDYDYQGIFEFQTALHGDKIVVRRGDFAVLPPPDAPIEILFIDVVKTAALNDRLVEHYFIRLVPGRSVIVQQDFYQAWYPHIPITMEYFRDWFAVADSFVAESSRLYLLTRKIPRQAIREFLDGLSVERETELLRRAIARESGLTRMMLRVVEVLHLCDRQDRREAARDAARALRRDPDFKPDAYYANQLETIERYRQFV